MSIILAVVSVLIKLFALALPGGAFLLQRNYKQFSIFLFSIFFAFSAPAWLRLWSTPLGFLLSIAAAFLIWFGYVIFGLVTKGFELPKNVFTSLFALLIYVVAGIALLVFCIKESESIWGYRLFHIPSESMQPTLLVGDYVLVNTWTYHRNSIGKGDIIVFKKPFQNTMTYNIKRVAYVAGDVFHEKKLTENQLAVIGDNRDNSEDSRVFGAITGDAIIGKAEWVVASVDDTGKLRSYRMGVLLR